MVGLRSVSLAGWCFGRSVFLGVVWGEIGVLGWVVRQTWWVVRERTVAACQEVEGATETCAFVGEG